MRWWSVVGESVTLGGSLNLFSVVLEELVDAAEQIDCSFSNPVRVAKQCFKLPSRLVKVQL
jgi:hypothetical protein